jgi:hypothetical protein
MRDSINIVFMLIAKIWTVKQCFRFRYVMLHAKIIFNMLNTLPASDVCSAVFVSHMTEHIGVMVLFRIQELSHSNIAIVPSGLKILHRVF